MVKKQKIAIGVAILLLIGGIWYYTKHRKTDKQTLKDVFENLNFEYAKAIIKPESFPFLDELADVLVKEPTWKIKIVGHTDNVGSDASNLELSKKRAIAVSNYLVTKGVDASKITTDGKGESMPIATNDTPEGRDKNRRVEFTILKPDQSIVTTIQN
jgi:OmpA-OmpF porin, OOP family